MHERVDVAVIGAGLAGLVTARNLALRGVSVLLVDRQVAPGDTIATTGIFVRKTLEDFSLNAACFGRWISDVTLWSPNGRRIGLRAEQPEFRVARMREVYRRLTDECARAGVEFAFGTRYINIVGPARPHSGRDGPLDNVVGLAAAGPTLNRPRHWPESCVTLAQGRRDFTVRTRVIVGADGARSAVARDLGLDRNREMIVGLEDVAPSSGRAAPAMHCVLDPRIAPGYVAWVVDDGEEVHIGTAGYANRFNPTSALRAIHEYARRHIGVEATGVLRRRGGLIPVGGILRNIACERGVLVGDAAGAPSPLTAGGIDPCFRLSAFAANVTAEALRVRDVQRLLEYDGSLFAPRFVARHWLRRALSAISSPLLAELAFATLAGPPALHLARVIFFARGSFPQPPRVDPRGTAAFGSYTE